MGSTAAPRPNDGACSCPLELFITGERRPRSPGSSRKDPAVGRVLGPALLATAESPAVAAVRASLVQGGLLSRWQRAGHTSQGRKARALLLAKEATPGLPGIAVIGAAGIADALLHRIFTTVPKQCPGVSLEPTS
jgi:hypothetical protein